MSDTVKTRRRWTALPATRSSEAKLNLRLYLVLGAAGVCALTGPAAATYVFTRPAPVTTAVAGDVAADGYARAVAEDFLSARTTAVPVADGVDPAFGRITGAGSTVKALPHDGLSLVSSSLTTGDTSTGGPTYNTSKFLFQQINANGTRKPMKIDVTMLVTEDGPVLAAEPALRPADLSATKYQALNYQEVGSYQQGSPSPDVTQMINEWAKAYTSGNSGRLAELIRDPQGGTYTGLGGFQSTRDVEVQSYVVETPANVATVHGVTPIDPVYVRARIWMRSTGADKFETSSDYDLLVFDSKTSAPYIVAWGVPGSAPLTPFTTNSNRH